MRIAFRDLRLDELIVVHGGKESWPMSDNIRAVSASHLLTEIKPLPV